MEHCLTCLSVIRSVRLSLCPETALMLTRNCCCLEAEADALLICSLVDTVLLNLGDVDRH